MTADLADLEALADLAVSEGGRNIAALRPYTADHLERAAASVTGQGSDGVIALVTGFVIPSAEPPRPETDGPIGAGILARAFQARGWRVLALYDEPCRTVLDPTYDWAGVPESDRFISAIDADMTGAAAWLHAHSVDHVLAIERPGIAADGVMRSMRAKPLTGLCASYDGVFTDPDRSWFTIAIGDGGNEIGMGVAPRDVIARHIDHGADIACATPADALLLAGVSNWGAALLLGALAGVDAHWRTIAASAFTSHDHAALLDIAVAAGAVDGVSLDSAHTVDGIEPTRHDAMIARLIDAGSRM